MGTSVQDRASYTHSYALVKCVFCNFCFVWGGFVGITINNVTVLKMKYMYMLYICERLNWSVMGVSCVLGVLKKNYLHSRDWCDTLPFVTKILAAQDLYM